MTYSKRLFLIYLFVLVLIPLIFLTIKNVSTLPISNQTLEERLQAIKIIDIDSQFKEIDQKLQNL